MRQLFLLWVIRRSRCLRLIAQRRLLLSRRKVVSRTLVTGFGPFRNVLENPSELLAKSSGRPFEVLEVSYEAADDFVATINPFAYDNLLLLGVAGDRSQVSLELEAQNLRSGADVRGASTDGLIETEGPDRLKSTMWSQELVEYLKIEYPHDIALSWDAGTYLCNYIYYKALRTLNIPRIGFLHVVMPDKIPLSTQEEIVRGVLSELRD